MEHQFIRTKLLLGKAGMERLYQARVAVFGVGGVGGFTVEALARSGIGTLDLIDNDRVSLSNINRQIIATHSTVGEYKVEVARRRVMDINPNAVVNTYTTFFTPATAEEFDFTQYDYVVDAIDTVTGKLELVERAVQAGTPIISSMGAGNKLDPTAFRVSDISKTSICPLARIMRKELKKRGIYHLKVVYSQEPAMTPLENLALKLPADSDEPGAKRRQIPGSTAFVPSVVGLIIAGEVIKDLSGIGGASHT